MPFILFPGPAAHGLLPRVLHLWGLEQVGWGRRNTHASSPSKTKEEVVFPVGHQDPRQAQNGQDSACFHCSSPSRAPALPSAHLVTEVLCVRVPRCSIHVGLNERATIISWDPFLDPRVPSNGSVPPPLR